MTVASPGWTFYPSDGCVHDRDKEGYLVRGFLLLSFPFQALTKNDGSVGKYSHDGVGMGDLGTEPSPDLLISTLEGKAHREKLELVASFSFFGNVMSMASVQLAGAKRDALLLSFKDAKVSSVSLAGGSGHSGVTGSSTGLGSVSVIKVGIKRAMLLTSYLQLSVVEYDPGTHDLKTLSLHYFEEPELRVSQAKQCPRLSLASPSSIFLLVPQCFPLILCSPTDIPSATRMDLCKMCIRLVCGWTLMGAVLQCSSMAQGW